MESKMNNTTSIVTRQQLAAYKAHRSMLAKQLAGATRAVRKSLKSKIAGYDALLADLIAA
jgi:hypothetical protein